MLNDNNFIFISTLLRDRVASACYLKADCEGGISEVTGLPSVRYGLISYFSYYLFLAKKIDYYWREIKEWLLLMVVSESFEESEICRSNDGGERLKKCPPPPLLSLPISSKLSLSQISSSTYYISKEKLSKKALKRRDISSLKWLQICSFLWGFNVAEAKFFRQNSSISFEENSRTISKSLFSLFYWW